MTNKNQKTAEELADEVTMVLLGNYDYARIEGKLTQDIAKESRAFLTTVFTEQLTAAEQRGYERGRKIIESRIGYHHANEAMAEATETFNAMRYHECCRKDLAEVLKIFDAPGAISNADTGIPATEAEVVEVAVDENYIKRQLGMAKASFAKTSHGLYAGTPLEQLHKQAQSESDDYQRGKRDGLSEAKLAVLKLQDEHKNRWGILASHEGLKYAQAIEAKIKEAQGHE